MHGVTADPSTLEACGPRPGPRQLRDKAAPHSSAELPKLTRPRGCPRPHAVAWNGPSSTASCGSARTAGPWAGRTSRVGGGAAGALRAQGAAGRLRRDARSAPAAPQRPLPAPPQVPRVSRRRLRAGLETPPAGQRPAPPPPDSYAASAFGRSGLGPSMDSDEDDDTRGSRTATVSHGGRPTRRSLRHRAPAPRGTLRHVTPGQQGPGEVTSRGPGRGLEGGCCALRSSRGGRSPSPVLGAAERREPANPGGTGPRGGPASKRGCWPVLRQAARPPCFQNPSLPFPRELEP